LLAIGNIGFSCSRSSRQTPSGELVTFNPGTGQQMVNGQPYNGPVMSQQTMDKQATAVQDSLGALNRLKSIEAMVAKNPNAFGGVATLSQLTPDIIRSRWQSAKLTPAERETRALVMTQAHTWTRSRRPGPNFLLGRYGWQEGAEHVTESELLRRAIAAAAASQNQ
jgi:hypothetical protein